jgi:hypothetical protein
MISKLLAATGSVLILHAAYSCLHYRNLLIDLEEAGVDVASHRMSVPPTDVWIEVMAAVLMILLGELVRTGSNLQPVVGGGSKRVVAPAYCSRDWDVYTTRGSSL